MPAIPTILRVFPYLVMVALFTAPSMLYATPPTPIPPTNTTPTPRKPPSPRWSRVQSTPIPSTPQDALPSAPNNTTLPPNHPPTNAAPPPAQQKAEEAPTLNAAQIQRYQNLTTLIIAPCCWVQPVSMHPSPASDQIKLDLKKRIVSGIHRQTDPRFVHETLW